MTDQNPLAFPTDEKNYNVAWKLMPDNWSSEFTDYAGRCALPIFVGADHWIEYEETGAFSTSPLFACIGILYSWPEPEKWLLVDKVSIDEFRENVFLHYGMHTNAKDLNELLISSSAWVRWNCGCVPSQRVLGGAIRIDPKNPTVRYDYVLDTWFLIERIPNIDLIGACESVLSIAQGADLIELRNASEQGQQNVNSLCYILLSSMLLLGMRDGFEDLYDELANRAMQAPGMQSKLRSAADKPTISVDDLRIFQEAVLVE